MQRDKFYLEVILDEIDFLEENLSAIEMEEFLDNEILKKAVAKTFENIGEAVKNLSTDIKEKYDSIDWRKISGLRDIITHRYQGIEFRILWDLYESKISELRVTIETILENEF